MWRLRFRSFLVVSVLVVGLLAVSARALLPPWLQHAVSGSEVEAALFRTMSLPGVEVMYPRPPAESVAALGKLVDSAPNEAALLSLRAHGEESALDFPAAERDWKAYAAKAADKGAAGMELAAFYGRRLATKDQFATLLAVGSLPPAAADAVTAPSAQRSWMAFEQALAVANDQSFADGATEPLWEAWMARYPGQPTVYARAFTWELNHDRTAEARGDLARYKTSFPSDTIFPVKAEALLELGGGGPDARLRALAVYDKGFAPLWPDDLLNSYFDLLGATHSTRRFVADAEARLSKNPDDLNAAARMFAYHRHQGHPEAALAVLAAYRESKEVRDPAGANWTPDELNTLQQLTASAKAYPDSARYAFALYHLPGKVADGRSAQEAGLAAMVGLLLDAPEQPIALGAGNLSMLRDIGTLDGGPGFWNGVLSLWLNDQAIQDQFAQQETKAQPYFHRAQAALLLQLLDKQAPGNAQRAALHAKLLQAYATYGEDAALLQAGGQFLQSFPGAPDRVQVALAMADADARRKDTAEEFALYDRLLQELGKQTGNLPLATAALQTQASPQPTTINVYSDPASSPGADLPDSQQTDADTQAPEPDSPTSQTAPNASRAFDLDTGEPAPEPSPAATAYAQVLDRTLGRLTAMHKLPEALAVLRRELDRNPNDPRLYERLATFLSQNNLSAQQEEVYRTAIAKFDDKAWYDKLARYYLRSRREGDFGKLTRQVTDIFSGTDLETYFAQVRGGGPQLALELNLYAHKRFPHDLVFTQNLLGAYVSKPTVDRAAWERLLRETWWQSPVLTNQFFAYLSRTGKLGAELAALPSDAPKEDNPAALQERAEAALWASHFEVSAPLFDRLAQQYPSDEGVGTTAADLNRSLAWLDAAGPGPHIHQAVAIEERLLSANPGDLNRLARIGDILADDADGTAASYRSSAVYWRRMPATAPGNADTYLQAATVFWDYFQFDEALNEIQEARTHFGDPVLYGYEAGAIYEGKRDFPSAVREYTQAALGGTAATDAPLASGRTPAGTGSVDMPVSLDPGANPAAARVLQLAQRPGTAALVNDAAEAEMRRNGSLVALQLRVTVLDAERRGAEAPPLLLAAVAKASTADAEAALASYAQTRSEAPAREAALAREAELTPDPTERLALRYELVGALEARKDLADAARLVDATYRDNPRILGVVRSTVDFDWRNQKQKQAVDVLVEAARAAQPPLTFQFTAEAATKANSSGDPARGRQLALGLLANDPYNAQYLSLAAQSYAQAGDLPGLETFYRTRLDALKTAPMSADERRSRTALLREGLIPALTQAKDFAGAVDQYIALVTAYPEDSGRIREAALYAAEHDQKDRLLSFYRGTVQSSPRDARYFVALAQTEALFGDAPAALDAYGHAVALRPERSDLFIAKAALEERLGRYDEAVADYDRLYQLSYKDPQWMVASAKAQARQGNTAETVHALETAYLHGARSTPHDRFLVAAQLEQWNMLAEAQHYAEAGAAAAGDDLLAGEAPRFASDDATAYARIMTRTRHTGEAFKTLRAALAAAAESTPSSPSTVAAQVGAQGLAAVTDSDWRKSFVKARQARASAAFDSALSAMGETVAKYGTPEDHTAYAEQLKLQRGAASRRELLARWIPAAHAAGLGALEASWRAEALNNPDRQSGPQLTPLVQLGQARLAFAELGHTLEAFLRSHPQSNQRGQALNEAVNAYGAASDTAAQLRLLRSAWASDGGSVGAPGPYLRLLAQNSPETLVSLAASKQDVVANGATEAALDSSSPALAMKAIAARGTALGPAWTQNYTALGGLYAHGQPEVVRAAFDTSLGLGATIGERLASGHSEQGLIGKPWFYLAGRYGEWLLAQSGEAVPSDDVLAADLEAGNRVGAYLALAQTEAEAGHNDAALEATGHALELAPTSATVYDMQAELFWSLNRKPQAIANWKQALEALRTIEDRGPAPEAFWIGFARIAFRVHEHSLYPELKPAMDATLRSYLSRNGTYRANDLLRAAYEAAPGPPEGSAWLIALAGAAKEPLDVLGTIDSAPWLPPSVRETLLERELTLARSSVSPASDANGEPLRLGAVRSQLVQLYLAERQGAQALALIQTEPPAARASRVEQEAEIVASAQTGALASLLQRFEAEPEKAPDHDTLKEASTTLANQDDWVSAQAVRMWNLERAQKTRQAVSADFLGVAEARLHTGDQTGGVTTLKTMIAESEDLDTDRAAAATLLEKSGSAAAALPFLQDLTRSLPWDASFRVRWRKRRSPAV